MVVIATTADDGLSMGYRALNDRALTMMCLRPGHGRCYG